MDSLKSFIQLLKEYLQHRYSLSHEKWKQQQMQQQFQQQQVYCTYSQSLLHNALASVLIQTTISAQLCPLRYKEDLVPCGFNIRLEDTTVYYFLWTKRNPQDTIPVTILERITNKINHAISNEWKRYNQIYQVMNDYEKTEFVKQNPVFYNGFHVIGCKDNTTDIILAVAFN